MENKLTKKERMRRVLLRQPVDRLPVQSNYTPVMARKLAEHFGIAVNELPARLDNHLLRVDLTQPKRLSEDGLTGFDWWGPAGTLKQMATVMLMHRLPGRRISQAFHGPTRRLWASTTHKSNLKP